MPQRTHRYSALPLVVPVQTLATWLQSVFVIVIAVDVVIQPRIDQRRGKGHFFPLPVDKPDRVTPEVPHVRARQKVKQQVDDQKRQDYGIFIQ
jgi:hypothetical protein